MGLHGRQNTLNAYVGIQYVCTCMRLHTVAGNEQNKKKKSDCSVYSLLHTKIQEGLVLSHTVSCDALFPSELMVCHI